MIFIGFKFISQFIFIIKNKSGTNIKCKRREQGCNANVIVDDYNTYISNHLNRNENEGWTNINGGKNVGYLDGKKFVITASDLIYGMNECLPYIPVKKITREISKEIEEK
ncbi:hypothetical protein DERP_007572 [Dermatophagoides pteronyssinus]|uniref:Uncharacterized protein n=1 Tax=Dermatophagoides pteronyssinus TaxID=6956 RepID=A0ABQ8JKY9_DERPT|nr:hypothetical protein DERP_007572 [Dermatophagoides pteronyssinus]